MEVGRLLASGRSADIYEAGIDRVVIRYRERRDLARQARILKRLAAAGYPAPRVHLVTEDALLVDRIDGPTMFEDLLAHPESIEAHAALLADLLRQLQVLGVRHRDLHPLNVILSPRGPVVIDWESAEEVEPPGNGEDVAETWLLLATADLPADLREAASRFLEAFLVHVDRDAAQRAMPTVVARRRADPHMSATELARMDEL